MWQYYLADVKVKRLRKELANLEILKFCIVKGFDETLLQYSKYSPANKYVSTFLLDQKSSKKIRARFQLPRFYNHRYGPVRRG